MCCLDRRGASDTRSDHAHCRRRRSRAVDRRHHYRRRVSRHQSRSGPTRPELVGPNWAYRSATVTLLRSVTVRSAGEHYGPCSPTSNFRSRILGVAAGGGDRKVAGVAITAASGAADEAQWHMISRPLSPPNSRLDQGLRAEPRLSPGRMISDHVTGGLQVPRRGGRVQRGRCGRGAFAGVRVQHLQHLQHNRCTDVRVYPSPQGGDRADVAAAVEASAVPADRHEVGRCDRSALAGVTWRRGGR